MRYILICLVLLLSSAFVCADDIVTMPTANQLKGGQVDLAAYYLGLQMPDGAPQHVSYQTLYVGLTDKFELDAHLSDVNKDSSSTVLVGSYKLLSENRVTPDLVFGCRNIAGVATTINPAVRENSQDRSYYVSAAKTFFFNPAAPGAPLVRVHLSAGTADWTLLGAERHKGLFGGLQFLLRPDIGAIIENDE